MGVGDRLNGLSCISLCILAYSSGRRGYSFGGNPLGNGAPGKPKLGGRENMEAMDTIVIDVGGSVGGLVTGDIDSGLRGDLLSSGEESLYWRKSVGIEVIGGLGTDIIAGRDRESIRGSSLVTGDGWHLPAGCWLLAAVCARLVSGGCH